MFGENLNLICLEINFPGWGMSGRLSGGSAAAYLEDQWPLIWRISGRLSADQRPLICRTAAAYLD